MTVDDELFAYLAERNVSPAEMGLAYGRRQHPDLDALPPANAYAQGWLDGLAAVLAQMPLLTEGPAHDPAEFMRRMYDPDVLPVTER